MTEKTLPLLENSSDVLRHAWHVAAFSEDVTEEPTQAWVAGEPWVLCRLDGRLVAFVDRCPHRLAPLSAGRVVESADGTRRLACGYHGWEYDGDGRCDLIPSLGRTGSVSRRAVLKPPNGLTEAYGLVWLAPEEPLTPIPDFPEWETPGFATARATTVCTPVGAAQIVDNFLDAAHFPFVHAESFGVAGETMDAGTVSQEGTTLTATFSTPYRDQGQVHDHTVRKTVGTALNVHLRLDIGADVTLGILLACVPEQPGVTRVVKLLSRNDISSQEQLAAFVKEEDQILVEDLAILERYPHRSLPLDPHHEVHTRVDRLSLAWRSLMCAGAENVPKRSVTPW